MSRWLLLLALTTGCAPDLRTWVPMDDGAPKAGGAADGALDPAPVLDTGLDLLPETTVTLDATDTEAWVSYDFERRGVVEPDLPWDLQVQRYQVAVNGGVSGDGGVRVAVLDGAAFADVSGEDVAAMPADAWSTDLEDADGDGIPEYVFADWYDYDSATHVLSPKPRVHLVQTVEGRVMKLVFEDYYDAAGTSGFLSFRWAELALD